MYETIWCEARFFSNKQQRSAAMGIRWQKFGKRMAPRGLHVFVEYEAKERINETEEKGFSISAAGRITSFWHLQNISVAMPQKMMMQMKMTWTTGCSVTAAWMQIKVIGRYYAFSGKTLEEKDSNFERTKKRKIIIYPFSNMIALCVTEMSRKFRRCREKDQNNTEELRCTLCERRCGWPA